MNKNDTEVRVSWADFKNIASDLTAPLVTLGANVRKSGLDPQLLSLVKLRASQINGCAFCVNTHADEARKSGIEPSKIDMLCVWRESPVFSPRERAALEWTEALTLVSETGVPKDVYESALGQFSDRELVYLTGAVVVINAWNRIAVAYRFPPERA